MESDGCGHEREFVAKAPSIKLIGVYNFETEIIEERKPVFLACVDQNAKFEKQKEVINRISKIYGEALKVCLLEEGFIGTFRDRFNIHGTPTFLIFVEGKEKERILGQADQETLKSFIAQSLPGFRDND